MCVYINAYVYMYTYTETECCIYLDIYTILCPRGPPWWLSSKESACNAGDTGDTDSTPESGRFLGGGHGNPLQYSCQENSIDRGAWWAVVHGVTKSQTQLK